MKIQLEQMDLMQPWPQLALRPGYHAMRVLVYVGAAPLGEVMSRPVRRGLVAHRGLRKRIAQRHSLPLLRLLAREGLAAGPEALKAFPPEAASSLAISASKWRDTTRWVERNILLSEGLPAPYRDWIAAAQAADRFPLPPVTVVVCTRDRSETLRGCIEWLKQLDYPALEILIVDNSRDPLPTREVVEQAGVTYTRCAAAGLSRARNAALAAAATRWVAFTDDDCRPAANWLRELVRPLQNTHCGCATGLILPAMLENAAEITFELYGGLGRGFQPRTFERSDIGRSRVAPVQTWRMGAGANMLLDGPLVRELGGFDEEMGPGGVGGCGEDTDVFYKLLRAGRTIHYAPRAVVLHHHRSSPQALRDHIYSYAIGHAAYHWRCFWAYRDYRSMLRLLIHMPRWFAKNLRMAMTGKTKYPFTLVFLEVRGTIVGPAVYTLAKARRLGRSVSSWLRHPFRSRTTIGPVAADPVPTPAHYDAVDDRKQSVRVA